MPFSARQGLFSQAQAAPALWTPADISGLKGWWDSQDTANMTLTGSDITAWDSKADNTYGLSAYIGNNIVNYPTTAGATINGLTTVRWDDSRMDNANLPGTFDSNRTFTLAYLYKVDTGYTNLRRVTVLNSTANNNYWLYTDVSTTGDMFSRYRHPSSTLLFDTNGGAQDDIGADWVMIIYALNNQGTGYIRINGTEYSNYGFDVTQPAWDRFTFGAFALGTTMVTPATQYGTQGSLGDLILNNTLFSTTESEKLEGYLAWKYALTAKLPASHPYKNAAPTV